MLAAEVTATEQLNVPVLPFLSVTVTVYPKEPATRGVPEIVPLEDIVKPAGRPVAEKVYGAPVPPVPTRVADAIGAPRIAEMLAQAAVGRRLTVTEQLKVRELAWLSVTVT